MNVANRIIWRGFGMIVLACASTGAMATPPAPAGSIPAEKDTPVKCIGAMYHYLPGDFNFCVAARDMQRGYYSSALEMLTLAAGWGSKKAQYALGLMHFNGDHIAVDRPLGLAWLALAAERHDPVYEAVLLSAHGKATPTERRRAMTLLATMLPAYADAVAARRAQRRFDRAMRELVHAEPYPSNVCIDGLTTIDRSPPTVTPSCPSVSLAVNKLTKAGDAYFEGWQGHVVVGPLQSLERVDGNDKSGQAAPRQR